MQVLRNIVPAIARTDDKDILTFPRVTVVILAGVQDLAGEIAQCGNVREIRNAANACAGRRVAGVFGVWNRQRAEAQQTTAPFSRRRCRPQIR